MELGWLLLLPLDPNLPSDWTIVYPTQLRNHNQVDSLLETTTLPNIDQAAPDIVICLPLGLMDSTTSQLSIINTYLLKNPLLQNNRVHNNNNSLMYQIYQGLRAVDLANGLYL